MEKLLRISELAKLTRLNPKTIRYYEAIKLIPSPRRTAVAHGMGYRLYSDEDFRRLAFIKQAKLLDLSLSEIRDLLATAEEGCCTSINPKVEQLVNWKLGEIDNRIAELQALQKTLSRLRQQFRQGLVRPERRRQSPVAFNLPCQDSTCESGKR